MFDSILSYARGTEVNEKGKKDTAAKNDPYRSTPKIRVAFKGMFGQGREAVAAALVGPEGLGIKPLIYRVEDRTPIKIGGTRPRKARRL